MQEHQQLHRLPPPPPPPILQISEINSRIFSSLSKEGPPKSNTVAQLAKNVMSESVVAAQVKREVELTDQKADACKSQVDPFADQSVEHFQPPASASFQKVSTY